MKTKLMTKLALATAVACAAVGARADLLYWQASDVKQSSESHPLTGENQYLAYLFATYIESSSYMYKVSKTTTLSAIKELLTSSDAKSQDISANAFIYNGSTAKLNSGYSATDKTASYSDNYVGWIGSNSGKGSRVDVFAVILDAATWANADNYMILTGSDGNPLSLTSWSNSETASSRQTFDFGSQANNTWYKIGSSVVPEPTSGVLLLVGVAALALRRKKAA